MEPETGQQTNIGSTPTITTDQIEQQSPSVNLPDTPSISSFLSPSSTEQGLEQEVGNLQPQNNELLSQIATSFGNLATQGQFTQGLEKEAGIGKMQTELVDVTNQINQKSLEFRREQERITSQAGLTVGQRNALLTDVSRKQNSEIADLELIKMARSNSLANAQSIIDRKVELQFGDEQRRLDGLKFIYGENKDLLTDKQDKLFQQRINREERAFAIEKDKYQTLEQEKLQLVRNAQANGAGNGVMSSILKSQSLEEAYRNAGSYGLSIDDKIKKAQYSKLLSELGGGTTLSEAELTGIPSQDLAAVIKATGAKSTKGMQDAIGVLTGLENLAGRNPEGTFIGFAPGIRFNFLRGGSARTERQSNIGDINAINLKVQQWASGASLTNKQEKQVKRLTPDKNDTDEQVKRKINQLTEYMMGQVSSELASQGIQSSTPSFNFFSSQPQQYTFDADGFIEVPDELISNEQFFQ